MQGPWGTWQRGPGPSESTPAGKGSVSVLYNSLLGLQETKTIDQSDSYCSESKEAEEELGTQERPGDSQSDLLLESEELQEPPITEDGVRMGREQDLRPTPP